MRCPICHRTIKVKIEIKSFNIFECDLCTHQVLKHHDNNHDKNIIYNDDYFFSGKDGYPNYLLEKKILINSGKKYARRISKYVEKIGIVLDVGAAAGFILKGFIESGWEGYGVEINHTMASYARSVVEVNVTTSAIEEYKSELMFDVVLFIQILEHLIDPDKIIARISKNIRKGGFILIETWNYKSITAQVFGTNWHQYSPPSVVQWFSPKSIHRLMRNNGFDFITYGRSIKKITWSHASALLSYKLNSGAIKKSLNRVSEYVPESLALSYPSEDLFWALYQKNI